LARLPEPVRRRLDPDQRFGLRATLCAVAFVLVGAPFLVLLGQVLSAGPLTELDADIATTVHGWFRSHGAAAETARVVSFVGGGAIGIPLGLALTGFLAWRGARRLAVFVVVALVGQKVIERTLKSLVGRDRPTWDDPLATAAGKSFPSGHAMGVTVTVGVLCLVLLPLVARRWRPWLLAAGAVWVALVGFSRIALGVHYLSDVLAGVVLGLAWLALVSAVFEVWRAERGRWSVEPLEEGLAPEESRRLRAP
jgi:undecaprenyl-diphosphatase